MNPKNLYMKKSLKKIYPIQSNKNIFDLCVELDKEAYYKFYILPLFEKFSNTYNNIKA